MVEDSRKCAVRDEEEREEDADDHAGDASGRAHRGPRRAAGCETDKGDSDDGRLQRSDVPRPAVEDGAVPADDVAGRRRELGLRKRDVAIAREPLLVLVQEGKDKRGKDLESAEQGSDPP